MIHTLRWRRLFILCVIIIVAVFLASCGYPVAGGMVAGGFFLAALLAGAMSLSAGCDSRTATQDAKIQPCLKPSIYDYGPPKEAAPKNDLELDIKVGPCLKIQPPDAGPKKDSQVVPDLSPALDIKLGPCLKVSLDGHARLGPLPGVESNARNREAVIDDLRSKGTISDELAERMRRFRG
jgi:hypothetical protein